MESPTESPAAGGAHRRKPLRPLNLDPAVPTHPNPKPVRIRLGALDAGKENRPVGEDPTAGRPLAEELGAARRRRERLRAERERTEEILRGRDREVERGLREVERRGEEQRRVEMELQRIIRFKDLRSCVRSAPVQSLRAREEEKRRRKESVPEVRIDTGPPSAQEKGDN